MIAIPVAVTAQAPEDRAALNRLRDSLRATRDTGALRTIERSAQVAVDKDHNKALALVRLGFVQLRQGEVTGQRGRFGDAEKSFNRAAAIYVSWPYVFLGRGLARLNLADNQSGIAGILPGFMKETSSTAAAADFAESGAVDYQFTEGLVRVAEIAMHYRHRQQVQTALLALRAAATIRVGRNPDVQVERLRLERVAGNRDSARAIADELVASHPDDAAILMEAAEVGMQRGDSDAATLWFRGLARADPQTALWYREDLRPVFPDSTLNAFDRLTGEPRVELVKSFLAGADPQNLHTPAERIREHYRRLDRARANFAIVIPVYRADVALPFATVASAMDEHRLDAAWAAR
jgi:Flp pilus assembly protein TadD